MPPVEGAGEPGPGAALKRAHGSMLKCLDACLPNADADADADAERDYPELLTSLAAHKVPTLEQAPAPATAVA